MPRGGNCVEKAAPMPALERSEGSAMSRSLEEAWEALQPHLHEFNHDKPTICNKLFAARALAQAAHWEVCGCDDPEEHEDICYQVEERGVVVKTYYCAKARRIAALGRGEEA